MHKTRSASGQRVSTNILRSGQPYIWAAYMDAETGLPWNGPNLSTTDQHLDTKTTGAFMIEDKAKYRSFVVFGDFNWLRLDTKLFAPDSSIPARILRPTTSMRPPGLPTRCHLMADFKWTCWRARAFGTSTPISPRTSMRTACRSVSPSSSNIAGRPIQRGPLGSVPLLPQVLLAFADFAQ